MNSTHDAQKDLACGVLRRATAVTVLFRCKTYHKCRNSLTEKLLLSVVKAPLI